MYRSPYVQELLGMNKLNELQSYLEEELTPKYFIEIAVYNTINTTRPTSIEQNANNALVFLDKLKIEKTAEIFVNMSN